MLARAARLNRHFSEPAGPSHTVGLLAHGYPVSGIGSRRRIRRRRGREVRGVAESPEGASNTASMARNVELISAPNREATMLSPRGVGCILPCANQKAPEPFGGCLLGRLRLIPNAHPHTSVAAVPTRAGEPGSGSEDD
jgi:hypothetical protein